MIKNKYCACAIINRGYALRLIPYLIVVLLILAVSGSITIRGGGGGGSLWRWQVDRAVSVCVMIHYAIVLKSRSSLRQFSPCAPNSIINDAHFLKTSSLTSSYHHYLIYSNTICISVIHMWQLLIDYYIFGQQLMWKVLLTTRKMRKIKEILKIL